MLSPAIIINSQFIFGVCLLNMINVWQLGIELKFLERAIWIAYHRKQNPEHLLLFNEPRLDPARSCKVVHGGGGGGRTHTVFTK